MSLVRLPLCINKLCKGHLECILCSHMVAKFIGSILKIKEKVIHDYIHNILCNAEEKFNTPYNIIVDILMSNLNIVLCAKDDNLYIPGRCDYSTSECDVSGNELGVQCSKLDICDFYCIHTKNTKYTDTTKKFCVNCASKIMTTDYYCGLCLDSFNNCTIKENYNPYTGNLLIDVMSQTSEKYVEFNNRVYGYIVDMLTLRDSDVLISVPRSPLHPFA